MTLQKTTKMSIVGHKGIVGFAVWLILSSKKEILSIDPYCFRPAELDLLIGDPTKSKQKLGWITEYDLQLLVKSMMDSDVKLFKKKKS